MSGSYRTLPPNYPTSSVTDISTVYYRLSVIYYKLKIQWDFVQKEIVWFHEFSTTMFESEIDKRTVEASW